jgi:hypothetical protein
MCPLGTQLFDEWWENSNLADILENPWRSGWEAVSVYMELSYEEANQWALAARDNFMAHRIDCRACRDSAFFNRDCLMLG